MKLLGFPAQRGIKLNTLLNSLLDQEQHGVSGFVVSFCQPASGWTRDRNSPANLIPQGSSRIFFQNGTGSQR